MKKTNIQYQTFNGYFCFFIFPHSTFDVGGSMFDVHLFQSLQGKNNLALMGVYPHQELDSLPTRDGEKGLSDKPSKLI
jgi:hypothetical protein